MPLADDLAAAEAAIKHVQRELRYGADTRDRDVLFRITWAGEPPVSLAEHQASRRLAIPGYYERDDDPRQNVAAVLCDAHDSSIAQVGNCDEQAAVAFSYLINVQHRTGVGVFGLNSNNRWWQRNLEFGHTFVVLGFDSEPPTKTIYQESHYPAGWDNAVWCDPWAEVCFGVREGWPHRVKSILALLDDWQRARRRAMTISCDAYYDGTVAPRPAGSTHAKE